MDLLPGLGPSQAEGLHGAGLALDPDGAVVLDLLGHASVVTTERYIHHTPAELPKAAAVLESGGIFVGRVQ